MAYLALYRKYRPKTFDEIVGQQAVVTALKNQVRYGQIGHAYLFCGTRGTGKTSTAKVFARAVNCLSPQDGNPCNECELCREGESGFNTIEIDAASNNGVDSIRDLREDVQYTPSRGKYKVYIIDEVHMLSQSAFNALLKTLEEPPEHVIFILATTDPQKVLPTIVSRCQRYDFRRLSTRDITRQLEKVCRLENIQADPEALSFIASASDGGMRDALSILDQCHSYYIDSTITLSQAEEVLGAVDHRIFIRMTDSLIARDTAGLLDGTAAVFESGRDALQFVSQWVQYLRNLMVVKVMAGKASPYITASEDQLQAFSRQASAVPLASMTKWIEALSQLEAQLKTSSQRRVLLEMTLIRLCAGTYGRDIGELPQTPEQQPASKEMPASNKETPAASSASSVKKASSGGTDFLIQNWDKVKAEIRRQAPYLILSGVSVEKGEKQDQLVVSGEETILSRLRNTENGNYEKFRSILTDFAGTPVEIVFVKRRRQL